MVDSVGEMVPIRELLTFEGLSHTQLLVLALGVATVFLAALVELVLRLKRADAAAGKAIVGRFGSLIMWAILLALLLAEWGARV